MFKKFERKLSKAEYENLMRELRIMFHNNEEKAHQIFIQLMENGSYTWNTGRFVNKFSIIFDTSLNVINRGNSTDDIDIWTEVAKEIERIEGVDKKYFLYRNYHKDPQMWRLGDKRCIWGMVHDSYKPLQNEYYKLFLTLQKVKAVKTKEQQKKELLNNLNQYVNFCTPLEAEETDVGK